MPSITPEEARARLHAASTPPTLKRHVPWGQILLIIAIVAGLIGYYFWQNRGRLPQERDLHFSSGSTMHVRIIAHDYTTLTIIDRESGDTFFVPISLLTPDDQEIVQKLDYFKRGLSLPVNWMLAGGDQPGQKIKVLGRSGNVIKYQNWPSGGANLAPIASFSVADQGFFVRLDNVMNADSVDIDHVFTDSKGNPLPGVFLHRDDTSIALRLPRDNTIHYFPVSDLSVEDQKLVNGLNSDGPLNWPIACTVFDAKGNPLYAKFTGRIPGFIMMDDPKNQSVKYVPLEDFSLEDQKVFQLLMGDILPRFPFSCTLTDIQGRDLPVTIMGRTDLDVSIQLANGADTTYPIDKLSSNNQELLRTLNGEIDTPEIKRLRDQNTGLELDDLKLNAAIADPSTPMPAREIDTVSLANNEKQIEANKLKIQAITRQVELQRKQSTGLSTEP